MFKLQLFFIWLVEKKEDMFTLVVLDSNQRRPKMTVNESD